MSSCTLKTNKVKIGFMVPTLNKERYPKEISYFTQKANELGVDVLVANADNNDANQIDQAKDLLAKGISTLVIIPVNQNTSAVIVRMAHDVGVKVIAYERLIQNADLDFFISYDYFKLGKLIANYAINKVPSGEYMLIGGDKTDYNAVSILRGQKSVIDSFSNGAVHIVYSAFIEDWDYSNAYFSMSRYLKYSSKVPDVILSSSDLLATGVLNALEENGFKENIFISGLNADLISCQRIVKGKQNITVYKPYRKQASMAAEIAIKLANQQEVSVGNQTVNNKRKNVPVVYIDAVIVDINNMKQTVIADGFYTEKQVYE